MKRIVYKPDGTVSIITAIGSTSFDDIQAKIPEFNGLLHDDVEDADIPQDRIKREKWRGSKGNGIHIDNSIITRSEKKQAIEDELDVELEKNNPDTIVAIKLQRKLDKGNY